MRITKIEDIMDKHYLDIGYNGDRAGYSFGGGEPDPPWIIDLPVFKVYAKAPDPLVEVEFNVKLGVAEQLKVKIFGFGVTYTANLVSLNLINASWNNETGFHSNPTVNTSLELGIANTHGGYNMEWQSLNDINTTGHFDIGMVNSNLNSSNRLTLIDIGGQIGLGYDLKITLSLNKVFDATVKNQMDFYNATGFSNWRSLSH